MVSLRGAQHVFKPSFPPEAVPGDRPLGQLLSISIVFVFTPNKCSTSEPIVLYRFSLARDQSCLPASEVPDSVNIRGGKVYSGNS